jgi:hypothetical protein
LFKKNFLTRFHRHKGAIFFVKSLNFSEKIAVPPPPPSQIRYLEVTALGEAQEKKNASN